MHSAFHRIQTLSLSNSDIQHHKLHSAFHRIQTDDVVSSIEDFISLHSAFHRIQTPSSKEMRFLCVCCTPLFIAFKLFSAVSNSPIVSLLHSAFHRIQTFNSVFPALQAVCVALRFSSHSNTYSVCRECSKRYSLHSAFHRIQTLRFLQLRVL